MADSKETIARLRMKTIIQGIIADPARVILGLDDLAESDPDFFDNLVTCGPKVYILGAECDNVDQVNKLYTFSVKVQVHYAFVPDTDEEYKAINNYMKILQTALLAYSNYTDCLPPTMLGYFKQSDVLHKGAIAGPIGVYEARFVFIAGVECV